MTDPLNERLVVTSGPEWPPVALSLPLNKAQTERFMRHLQDGMYRAKEEQGRPVSTQWRQVHLSPIWGQEWNRDQHNVLTETGKEGLSTNIYWHQHSGLDAKCFQTLRFNNADVDFRALSMLVHMSQHSAPYWGGGGASVPQQQPKHTWITTRCLKSGTI